MHSDCSTDHTKQRDSDWSSSVGKTVLASSAETWMAGFEWPTIAEWQVWARRTLLRHTHLNGCQLAKSAGGNVLRALQRLPERSCWNWFALLTTSEVNVGHCKFRRRYNHTIESHVMCCYYQYSSVQLVSLWSWPKRCFYKLCVALMKNWGILDYRASTCKQSAHERRIHTDSTTFEVHWLLVSPRHPRKGLKLRCKTSPNLWSYPSWRKRVMNTEKIEPATSLIKVSWMITQIYLSGDISNWSHCNLRHPMNARVARPSSLRLLFNGARRRENVFIRLRIKSILVYL